MPRSARSVYWRSLRRVDRRVKRYRVLRNPYELALLGEACRLSNRLFMVDEQYR